MKIAKFYLRFILNIYLLQGGFKFNIWVIRNTALNERIDPISAESSIEELKQATYKKISLHKEAPDYLDQASPFEKAMRKRMSFHEKAPAEADCVSATAYFLFKSCKEYFLPIALIGDLPRTLIKDHSWQLLKVTEDTLSNTDLIFVKTKSEERLIDHLAWVMHGMIHHFTHKGIIVEELMNFMEVHEQPYEDEEGIPCRLLNYTDRRNKYL